MNFDIELNSNNLEENVKLIALQLKPQWSQSAESIQIKCLSGGITNSLYACYLQENDLNHKDTILFRIYGPNTEDFISRSDEIQTMIQMKACDIGPQYYGNFKNGICYELLPGTILDRQDVYVEKIYSKVALQIAKMHFSNFEGFKTADAVSANQEIFLFNKLWKLFSLLKTDYQTNMRDMTDEYSKSIPIKSELEKEINFVKICLTAYTTKMKSLLVFSHNDLLLGNIIYDSALDVIKFIDYEYGAFNFQAYDIANHFNEFAGVDSPDYSLFPNKDYQLKWLTLYLNAFYEKVNEFYADKNEADQAVLVDTGLVESFYTEVNMFTAASHLLWGIWSLVQAQNSNIEFNFVNYAHIRLNEYFKSKQQFLC